MGSPFDEAFKKPLDPNFVKKHGKPHVVDPAVAEKAIADAEQRPAEPASNTNSDQQSEANKGEHHQ